MRSQQKRWPELAPATKGRMMGMGVLQFALLGAALWDLRRRSVTEVRGNKKVWIAVVFINFLGPLAYFFLGRKPRQARPPAEQITPE